MASNVHEGHRDRIIKRLAVSGENFSDHELLEIILFNVIPRVNTNPLAHTLLNEFGSLAGVFRASISALCSIKGVGPSTAAYLRGIAIIMERAKKDPLDKFPLISKTQSFLDMVQKRFRDLKDECIEFYAADDSYRVIGIDHFTAHERNFATLSAEQIMRFFSKFYPKNLVIAHNHIDYNCFPSHDDDVFTRKMQMICSLHDTRLCDHIIVNGSEYYSYFYNNRFDYIKQIPIEY